MVIDFLQSQIADVAIPGASLALSLGVVAIGYGVTRAKAESAERAVERLGERMDKRLDHLSREMHEIGGDVREIQGELKSMRAPE